MSVAEQQHVGTALIQNSCQGVHCNCRRLSKKWCDEFSHTTHSGD